jgi:His-Xaa-Ser system radical SAM maturase HxsC
MNSLLRWEGEVVNKRVSLYKDTRGVTMLSYIINHECNNNCLFCAFSPRFRRLREPSTEEIIEFINQTSKNAPNVFYITGGEPTIRKDLFLIFDEIKNKLPNTSVALTTNARMFCYEHYAKKLKDVNLSKLSVYVNLSGHESETHDRITRMPGSFDQTIRGIRNLLKYKINVEVRVMFHKINYRHLPEIAKYLAVNFSEISKVVFAAPCIAGNAWINKSLLKVRYSEVAPYLEEAIDILLKNGTNPRIFSLPLCILKEEYRKFAKMKILYRKRIKLLSRCKLCRLLDDCFGIWGCYLDEFGDKEFKPIR